MSESDRRKFLRVLFEANFEVRANEWFDKEATGLDISLNGCRFNCKQAMSDGEKVVIVFKSGLELEGSVRWCWPIEWYFQAALCFEGITQEKQALLKAYIEDVTGERYQMQNDLETTHETVAESVEILDGDLDDIDNDLSASILDLEDQEVLPENSTEEDKLDELPPLEEGDLFNLDVEEPAESESDFSDVEKNQEGLPENSSEEDKLDELQPLVEEDLTNLDIEEPTESKSDFSDTGQDDKFIHGLDEGDINILSFAGQQVVLYGMEKDQAELLIQYLTERARMDVEYVTKKENLWRMLKIDPMDLVIIETGADGDTDALEVMQQTKDQFTQVQFICISGPVSLEKRLQFLNAGAIDYLTRPVHLSTIAQSILVHLSHTLVGDNAGDIAPQLGNMVTNKELQEELASVSEQRDEAIANAKANALELNEAKAAKKELELRAQNLAEEKESIYSDKDFITDDEPIKISSQMDSVDDLNGVTSILVEDLTISEEIDLIEEDY